ncbi:hypothetical protein ETD83_18060 [Actinomadura soli]|uniref:Peptidase inhibitor family I36 n=1 Tax=Actinomadura soli TaxID=2508997 RepID=A0A5C4JBR8_9ACTN|nr:peptidase inhibitor family I36 protein [Actinomadura soli]TMQ99257.1 hypothetical protein ETD83_18060 [Actinomadura soli]
MFQSTLATSTRMLATTAIVGAALFGAAGTALAAPPDAFVQAQIDQQLRTYPGGVQTGADEVSYKGGSVIVTFPSATNAANPCTAGWYCFYQHKDFTGRKLSFRDCGGNQSLTDYGFGNQTSSWDNTTKHTVEVYDRDVSPFATLWREAPRSSSSQVSATTNEKADFFHTYCGS